MAKRRIFSVLWVLVLAGTALAPAPALADHDDDDDFSVLLGPDGIRETDGGFAVSVELAGSTLSLTFTVDEDEDVQVRSVRGLPDGATADVDGEDVEVAFPNGDDVDLEVGALIVHDGRPRLVKVTTDDIEDDDEDEEEEEEDEEEEDRDVDIRRSGEHVRYDGDDPDDDEDDDDEEDDEEDDDEEDDDEDDDD